MDCVRRESGIGDMRWCYSLDTSTVRAEISNQASTTWINFNTFLSFASNFVDWFNRDTDTAWRWTSTFMFKFNCHHQLRRDVAVLCVLFSSLWFLMCRKMCCTFISAIRCLPFNAICLSYSIKIVRRIFVCWSTQSTHPTRRGHSSQLSCEIEEEEKSTRSEMPTARLCTHQLNHFIFLHLHFEMPANSHFP